MVWTGSLDEAFPTHGRAFRRSNGCWQSRRNAPTVNSCRSSSRSRPGFASARASAARPFRSTRPRTATRHRARHRRISALPRQRPQRTNHAAHHPDMRSAARLARRTSRRTTRSAVPQPPTRTPQPRRSGRPRCQTRPHRSITMPIHPHQERLTPRPSPHLRDEPARRRNRYLRHRALARPRRHRDHTIYLHADLAIKERALARTTPPGTKPGRYRPPDTLLAYLEAL